MVSGKTWRTQHDPWRGLSKTAFGIDYFRPYRATDPVEGFDVKPEGKIMELDCLDHDDNPCYGWDVHVQRLVWLATLSLCPKIADEAHRAAMFSTRNELPMHRRTQGS